MQFVPIMSVPAGLLGLPLLLQSVLSPAFWRPVLMGGLRIAIIFAIGLVVLRLVKQATDRWMTRFEDVEISDPRRQRAATLSNLIQSSSHYIIWPIIAIMALSELGLDVGALIATAGVAGLAIGFGAQTLVKDVIGGVFLLFDDIIRVGNLVNIGGTIGTVEEIGVRLIKVRKFDGELVMIPAGEIRTFGNKSMDWARVIVPVGLSYEQNVDTILPSWNRWPRTGQTRMRPFYWRSPHRCRASWTLEIRRSRPES